MYRTLQSSPENKEKPPHESNPWQNHSTPWLLCDTCHVYQYSTGGQSLHTPCAQPSCLCSGSVAERWNLSYDRSATWWCHQAIHMVRQMPAPHKIWSSLIYLSNIPVVHRHVHHTEQHSSVSTFVNCDVLRPWPFLNTFNVAVVQHKCKILH